MQGISSAPTAPGMVASTASADAAASGAGTGDVTAGFGGSLFGAILAGQLKGRTLGGNGMDLAALVADVNRRHGATTGQTDETGQAPDVLGDLLAAAGINMAAFIPLQASGFTVPGETRDSLSESSLSIEAGELPVADELGAGGRRPAATDDAGTRPEYFSMERLPGEVEGGGNQRTTRSDANARGEDFAAGGKNLPVAETPIQSAGLPDENQPIFSDTASSAGNTQLPIATPTAMPLTQASSTPVQTNATSAMEISVPVNSPAWGESLGNKMVWMSGQGSQVAELRLDPPHLGPLEVRLTMNSDQASISFVSHHPAVREAIESAMPRLREMLADNGIMLGNASVGAESFQQQQQTAAENARNSRGNGARNEEDGLNLAEGGTNQTLPLGESGRGLVDMFV